VFRITKEDAGVLRTKVRWKAVKIEAEQEKLYRKLERDMVVDVDNTIITTPLTVTQIGKLQQITGGQIIDEDGNIHRVGRAKQKALHNILMEEDELPIVIFCKYTHEVEECVRIAKRFYDKVSMLNGSVKDKTYKRKPDQLNRTWMLQAFQRGEIDVLVCQQRTGGVGVDMYLSNFAIVYSCSHSFIDFDQMTSRLDVFEKKVPSEMLVLYIRSTIDEDIRTAIKDKVSVTTATLNRLRRKDYQNAKDRKRG
jgi:ERCC4-related helicase